MGVFDKILSKGLECKILTIEGLKYKCKIIGGLNGIFLKVEGLNCKVAKY